MNKVMLDALMEVLYVRRRPFCWIPVFEEGWSRIQYFAPVQNYDVAIGVQPKHRKKYATAEKKYQKLTGMDQYGNKINQ